MMMSVELRPPNMTMSSRTRMTTMMLVRISSMSGATTSSVDRSRYSRTTKTTTTTITTTTTWWGTTSRKSGGMSRPYSRPAGRWRPTPSFPPRGWGVGGIWGGGGPTFKDVLSRNIENGGGIIAFECKDKAAIEARLRDPNRRHHHMRVRVKPKFVVADEGGGGGGGGGGTNGVMKHAHSTGDLTRMLSAVEGGHECSVIHEMTHFSATAGTSDYAYGQTPCRNLAINNPGFAINNADSHEYVAENTPGLSCGSAMFTITIQAESYSNMFGVVPENTSDVGGGRNVGNINTGDWMSYPAVTIPTTGTYRVEYRVAGYGGSLQFEKAGGTPVYGRLSIPVTGGWQTWTTISHTVSLSSGSQFFGIKATAGGWNLNWFRITKV
ncbi:hypothetical protein ACHAXA_004792 [Cyclostephanos tholiformis]|uniref:CBM6 domain-containing protein n=1 Tax=Cyclostephanos tholiformis TaxID=382380 RepID=A0ABD3REI7_9STRA